MSADYQMKQLREEVDRRLKAIADELAKERAKVAGLLAVADGGGFKPYKPYPSMTTEIASKGLGNWRTPEIAQQTIDDLHAQDLAVKPENDAAATHNRAVIDAAIDFCKRLGLPERERVPKKRARGWDRTELVTARWLTGLQSVFPPPPNWYDVESRHRDRVRAIDDWRGELAREQYQREEKKRERQRIAEEERERIQAEARRLAATMIPPAPPVSEVERLRSYVPDKPAPAVGGVVPPGERLEIE